MISFLSRVVRFSIHYRWLVLLVAIAAGVLGAYSFQRLPIDAVPDITNVQVQINVSVQALAPIEVEQQVTSPLESAMSGIPHVEQVRSLSRYGLSQVTVVFEDGTDIYWARQLISERIAAAKEALPPGVEPELGPIATGLGEIFLWTVEAEEGARKPDGTAYTPTDLREVQDWVVRPQLRNVPGVTEVNAIGGFEKLYQVAPDPQLLVAHGVAFRDVLDALARNNAAAGGGYIEHQDEQYLVRAGGLVKSEEDIRSIVVRSDGGVPIRIADVAEVEVGGDLRTGAATFAGEEVVLGTAIMLVGENSRTVSKRVRDRLAQVKKSLPAGVGVRTVYDRTYLVDATLDTVTRSLLEGAALVIVVLFLLLGNLRAALITAFVIPLSMLIAVTAMRELGVSGNLMSLGAIDFGLIIDGAVVVVENSIRRLAERQHQLSRTLDRDERLELAYEASREVLQATLFGQLVIAVVYLPILTLTGIEGKMFHPMALTVLLALGAATALSMTLIPALVAMTLTGTLSERENLLFRVTKGAYEAILRRALAHPFVVLGAAASVVGLAVLAASTLGSEFVPKLGEGAFTLELRRLPSISMTRSVAMEKQLERRLLEEFPDEIEMTYGRIGTAEVATDPMGPDSTDVFMMLKPREQWTKAKTQDELARVVDRTLKSIPGHSYEFSQPIEMRFNELISGIRADVAVKVFGDDLDVLRAQANRIAGVLATVPGVEGLRVEQITGLPILDIEPDREALARYGLSVEDVHRITQAAVAGTDAGVVIQGDRRFKLVVRLPESVRGDLQTIEDLPVSLPRREDSPGAATFVPLSAVAHISLAEAPYQVSREGGKRRMVVQCNVSGRDLGGFVADAQKKVDREVALAPGTWIDWGGQFENLLAARRRLTIVVPAVLALIFGLLFLAFRSVKNAVLIFSGVPLALTGGVGALALRGLPFSITAAIGFIALSGVAVLNGLVMVNFIENLRRTGVSIAGAIHDGSLARLRPVLMTALVAALGFVPMALATGTGGEVQRPLATVVIGGILSSTLLTLVVLPVLYGLLHREERA